MPVKIETPSGVAPVRGEVLSVNPEDVLLGRNSRGPHKIADYDRVVRNVAVSISENGQQVPALGHRDAKTKQAVLDDGFTRRDAVMLLRVGFTDDEGKTYHDPDAKLVISIDTDVKNDKDAFLKSVIGNQRNNPTDVQEAYAHSVLREEYGMVNAEIARHYGYNNQNRVDRLEKLLSMPDDVIEKVHTGKLAMSVAVDDLLTLDPAIRTTIIEKSTDDKGRVQGPRVREYVRALSEGTLPEGGKPTEEVVTPAPATKKKPGRKKKGEEEEATEKLVPRTKTEILTFLDYYGGLEDGSAAGIALVNVMARWVRGQLKTNVQLQKALDSLK